MKNQQHIIIFRLSAMGDVAMTVPVIKSFVQQYPEVKITFVSRSFLQPLFSDIDNVSFFAVDTKNNHKGFLGLISLFKELKSLQPTHFADFHNVLRSKIIRVLFSLFSKVRIAKIDKGRKDKKALTREKNKVFKQLKTSHQRYADVLNELGFTTKIEKDILQSNQGLSKKNIELFGEKKKKWIGIAPFAAFPSKTYPADLMLEVIEGLSKENVRLFLFGGKADIDKLQPIESKFSNVTSVAGKLGGLTNELNLIANLDAMLSMDSGNAHFAAMLGIKTITLWGSTHPYAGFAPFNQPNDYCILPNLEKYPLLPTSIYGNETTPGYENVMRSISPNMVIKKIKEVI
ncbi:glycosyltransferase family 9 protein [Tenacibaculum sp. MEBiC06402]|uniref:glycosyltransferase family 9 protein n=1 Tax=unclassified Tenacibaculum TaxID=2635139 RepID=UPI003B9C4A3C